MSMPFMAGGAVAASADYAQSATSAAFALSTAGATGAVTFSSTTVFTSTATFSSTATFTSAVTFSAGATFRSTVVVSANLSVVSIVDAFGYFVSGLQVVSARGAFINSATGGGTLAASDTQARSAISAILSAMILHGLISAA